MKSYAGSDYEISHDGDNLVLRNAKTRRVVFALALSDCEVSIERNSAVIVRAVFLAGEPRNEV